jgi:hydrogenase nickel incorporation protein HypB
MCEVCGCGDPHKVSIDVHTSLLADNDHEARHLREHFVASGVLALNLMGSPGSGKTALIEATARALAGDQQRELRLAAVSGDLATSLDAERLAGAGVPSSTITTGSACHLDAAMVHHALHDEALAVAVKACDVFLIENVGNLVCPAIYDLGQRANVVVLSVTEGVDKPLKYPVMFHKADLVVLTKVDLLPYLPGVSLAAIRENLSRVMPSARAIEVSATTGVGVSDFIDWLVELRTSPAPPATSAVARTRAAEAETRLE